MFWFFTVFFILLSYKTLLFSGIFAVLTVLYAIPFLNTRSLRTVRGLKIFVVALVWAGVTVLVPLIEADHVLSANTWITFIERFLIVVALVLPFEIRDLPYDQSVLGTLPQLLGKAATNILATGITGIAFILESFKGTISFSYAISLLLICLLSAFATFFAEKEQAKYYASFWVEGIPILWLGVLYLLRYLLT